MRLAQREVTLDAYDRMLDIARRNILSGQVVKSSADNSSFRPMQERVIFKDCDSSQFHVKTTTHEQALMGYGIPIQLQTSNNQVTTIYLDKTSLKKRFPKIKVEEFSPMMRNLQTRADVERRNANALIPVRSTPVRSFRGEVSALFLFMVFACRFLMEYCMPKQNPMLRSS